MISGISKASCDCNTQCVDILRGFIISVCDIRDVYLPKNISTSTGADDVVRLMYSTNQSSVINATIIIGAACLCRSQVIYVRGLLSLSVSANIEDGTTAMKDGTYLDFVISDNSRECCVFI